VLKDSCLCITQELPAIFVPCRTVLVNNGDSAVLVCEAEGIPQPNITWYRDGIQVRTVFLLPVSGLTSLESVTSISYLRRFVLATKYVNYIDVFWQLSLQNIHNTGNR